MNLLPETTKRFDYLAARWATTWSAFSEYVTEMKKLASAEGGIFLTASRKPFQFEFSKGDKIIRVTASRNHIKVKEFNMVSLKKNTPEHLKAAKALALQPMPTPKKKPVAKKPTSAAGKAALTGQGKKPTGQNIKADPNDLTPPDFLNRTKGMTKEQIAEAKAKADRADRDENKITMPETKPQPAPTKAKVEAAQAKGAKTPKQLAADLDTNDRKLRRVLRALAKQGKISHDANGRWLIGPTEVAVIKAAL